MKASKSASAIGTRCLSSGKACRVAMAFVAPAPPANESVARNALSRAKVSSRADANSQQRLDASERFPARSRWIGRRESQTMRRTMGDINSAPAATKQSAEAAEPARANFMSGGAAKLRIASATPTRIGGWIM